MMFSRPADAIRKQLQQLENEEQDRTLLRLGVALFTMTLASFAAFTMFYAKRAARETYQLAQTLLVLVFVYAVYNAMTRIITYGIELGVRNVVKALVERGNMDDRLAKAIGVVTAAAMLYATYRVMKWSVSPIIDSLPTPDEQTDIYEYVRERHGDTEQTDDIELEND